MKKNIMIIGDSYSTYKGYIPEGYRFYYCDQKTEKPIVNGVERTWWRILARENNLQIVCNDSYSGSTICNTVREALTVDTSFVNRMDKYIENNFFVENKIDTMLIFGGTNDSWIDAPIGEVKYADWTEAELKCVLPAFCYLLDRAKSVVDNIMVILNTDLKEEITNGFAQACEKNQVKYVWLKDIDKENGHPTEAGMEQIAAQVAKAMKE